MSYGTLADWRVYAAARGNTAPTDADDTTATQALTRAQDYIKYSYVCQFVSPYDETADGVEYAVYEAANLELATPGFFTTTFTPAQQKILTKVDVIQWTPVGGQSRERAGALASPRSTLIDAMLSKYMPDEKFTTPFLAVLGA